MTSHLLSHALLATTLAFSASAHADEDTQSYVLRAIGNKYPIVAKGTTAAFEEAVKVIVSNTQNNIFPIGWKSSEFTFDVGTVHDARGNALGGCKVTGKVDDNKRPYLTNLATFGFHKTPVTYTASCQNAEQNATGHYSARTTFKYE